jgi:hypothetical protein
MTVHNHQPIGLPCPVTQAPPRRTADRATIPARTPAPRCQGARPGRHPQGGESLPTDTNNNSDIGYGRPARAVRSAEPPRAVSARAPTRPRTRPSRSATPPGRLTHQCVIKNEMPRGASHNCAHRASARSHSRPRGYGRTGRCVDGLRRPARGGGGGPHR